MEGSSDRALRVIRPALELALGVARSGVTGTPMVAPPAALRPILGHTKLGGRTLAVIRDAAERDEAFRKRVVEEARPESLGPVAYAWLTRQPGWEELVDDAVGAHTAVDDDAADRRAERQARRAVEVLEGRVAKAEADAVNARTAAAEATRQRDAATDQVRSAEGRVGSLTEGLAALNATVAGLEEALTDANRSRRQLEALVADAHRRIDVLVGERDAALAEARTATGSAAQARSALDARQVDADRIRGGLGEAIADAAQAAEALGRALGAAAGLLDGRPRPRTPLRGGLAGPTVGPSQPAVAPSDPAPPTGRARRPEGDTAFRRQPIALPPATFDDSHDAAVFLIGVAGVVLAVDGYNVTLTGWPDLDLPAQRSALLDRLATVAARTGTEIRVFFDGDEAHALPQPRGRARDAVRVTFSAAGTDADEDIIDFVADLDPRQSVVVATSDRRVADEVRRRGANVVTSAQLLGVIGRTPER